MNARVVFVHDDEGTVYGCGETEDSALADAHRELGPSADDNVDPWDDRLYCNEATRAAAAALETRGTDAVLQLADDGTWVTKRAYARLGGRRYPRRGRAA